jgi:hypothetical protein
MRERRCLALAMVLAAGCFAPEAREGLPCSERGDCPPGQSCSAGVCRAGAAVVDASAGADGPVADAAPADPPPPFGEALPVVLMCPGPVVCGDAREPFLGGQGKTLLFSFVVNAVNGNVDIFIASRSEAQGAFGVAGSVGMINTTLAEHAAFLSQDGLRLWFAREDLSGGGTTRPYDEVLLSTRVTGPFNSAMPVPGAVNTALGDERSPQVVNKGDVMLFSRAAEATPADHDVYLARFEGGQWNTVERVAALNNPGSDEPSLSLVEERRAIFFIRDQQIHEAIWTGDDPTDIAVEIVHDELDADPLDGKIGVWSSADGSEVWFDSNRSGTQQIYRAVRPAPTRFPPSGGRTGGRPIP